ncbi:alpha/beta hydrolase [Mucilaginibacter sp. McL0603]|uniref:alpha/beta hydrolase n=1 Tax=Mucilaginibacter sp. McL0603 TaxID=3415670 RepID=UPI003CF53E29
MSSKDPLCTQKRWHSTLMLVLLILSGSTFISYGQSVPYPPTGKLVDAGGHLLHIHVMGKGKPVVVFENGSGDFSFIWDLVQPEVSETVTTVSYDRAGYAWSEAGPLPRSGRQIAYELHTALRNAGISGPYILVGQSYGGFLVRSFARFYKNEIAGVVLVDALNEDSRIIINNKPMRIREWAKGEHAPEPQNKTKQNSTPDTPQVVKLDTTIEPPLNKLSVNDQKMQIWAQSQPAYRKAGGNEMNWSPEDVADMYANKGKPEYMLDNIPLVVLSRGNGGYSGLADSAVLESERIQLQRDLAHLSTNSKIIFDNNSGHNIHLDDPALVIDAIRQVIGAYKTDSRL